MAWKFSSVFLVSFAMLVSLIPLSAFAQIEVPHQFYGDVTVNGRAAPNGLSVVAMIDGEDVANTITYNGRYGHSDYEIFYISNPEGTRDGKTIEFFVAGAKGGEATFYHGKSTELDLSVSGIDVCGDGSCTGGETCSTCPQDCGACSTGGGGSSGGGSSGGGSYTPPCEPDWQCSSWSVCKEGSQTRNCIDFNECDTDVGKPAEEQVCGVERLLPSNCTVGQTTCVGDDLFECGAGSKWYETETCEFGCASGVCLEESEGEGAPVTGMFLDPTTGLYALVILIIIALIAAATWKIRKS